MKKWLPVLITFLLTSLPETFAQVGPGPPPPTGIPIDGGLSFFLGLGAAAGAKLLYDSRKKS